jgi:hypothetical protein
MAIPTDPTSLLGRKETAKALTEVGFPTSPATLSTKASRGGGPPYSKFGPRALYRWGAALAWAEDRLAPSKWCTSGGDLPGDPKKPVAGR